MRSRRRGGRPATVASPPPQGRRRGRPTPSERPLRARRPAGLRRRRPARRSSLRGGASRSRRSPGASPEPSLSRCSTAASSASPPRRKVRVAFRQLLAAAGGREQLCHYLVRPERIGTYARQEVRRGRSRSRRTRRGRLLPTPGGATITVPTAPFATARSSRASSRSRPSVGARRPEGPLRERSGKKRTTREA